MYWRSLRVMAGLLVFTSIFFFPLTSGIQPRPSINELKTTSPPPVVVKQPALNESPPGEAGKESREAPVHPGKPLPPPPPGQALAVEPSPADTSQLIKQVDIQGKVGLSFDDGPYSEMTGQYLKALQKCNVRATFFMIGQRIRQYPGEARKVIELGSEIGSHSWRHARLDKLEREEIAKDLRSVAQQVYESLGDEIGLFRPPYGRYSENVIEVARELNQQVVLWNVDPRDWENPPPEEIVSRVLSQVKPGSIIILHEGRKNTLQALPEMIQKLRERGLEPVPVSELLDREEALPAAAGAGGP